MKFENVRNLQGERTNFHLDGNSDVRLEAVYDCSSFLILNAFSMAFSSFLPNFESGVSAAFHSNSSLESETPQIMVNVEKIDFTQDLIPTASFPANSNISTIPATSQFIKTPYSFIKNSFSLQSLSNISSLLKSISPFENHHLLIKLYHDDLYQSILYWLLSDNPASFIKAIVIDSSLVYIQPHFYSLDIDPDSTPFLTFPIKLDSIEYAIETIKMGGFCIVVDDEDRENEGDLVCAAEFCDEEMMAFMIRYSSGVICAPMTAARLNALQLPLMVQRNEDSFKTAYTITVDYKTGNSTGISAGDRSRTVQALASNSGPDMFARPGHVFPLRAHPSGVLFRPGHTEASVDLCNLANVTPVAVISEIVNDDGTMSRMPDLIVKSKMWRSKGWKGSRGMCIISIEDLVRYRVTHGV